MTGVGNDHDTAPDSDVLTVTGGTQGATVIALDTPVTLSGGGVLTIHADGSYTFAPGTAYNGLAQGATATETISYAITDGNGGTAMATLVITIQGQNDAPVVIDPANPGTPQNPIPAVDPLHVIPDVATTDGATPTPVDVGAILRDPDGEALTFTATGLPTGLAIDPATGIITGTLPADASQHGPYTVHVTATDPHGATATTDVIYKVINLAPVAVNDTGRVSEHGPAATGNVLGNDHDTLPDSDPLTVTGATTSSGGVVTLGQPVRLPEGGTLTLRADGSYGYDPGTDFTALAAGDSKTITVRYVISDSNGGSATAALILTVQGQNDVPIAVSPQTAQHGNDAAPVTPVDASAYFKDPDHGDRLTYTASNLPKGLVIDPITGVISGIIGSHASVQGPYLVMVTATDTHGGHADATFNWTVANPPPLAAGEHEATTAGVPLKATLAGNDTDPDGDALHYAVYTGPSHGKLTLNLDGTYTYEADSQYSGPDSFVYAVIDADGGVGYATCTIKVQAALNITQMAGSGRGPGSVGSHDPFQRAQTGADGLHEYIHPVASDDSASFDVVGGSEHIRLVVEGAPHILDRQYGAGLSDAPMRSVLGIGIEASGSGATVFEPMADMPFWHGLRPLDLSPHQQAAALVQPQAVASDWDLADAPAQLFSERMLVIRSQFDRNALQLTADLAAAA